MAKGLKTMILSHQTYHFDLQPQNMIIQTDMCWGDFAQTWVQHVTLIVNKRQHQLQQTPIKIPIKFDRIFAL